MAPSATDPDGEALFHRLVAESAADVHTVTTADGIYTYVSSASRARFGWAPHDLVGKPACTFVHPDDAPLADASYQQSTTRSDCPVTTIARFRCRDGSYRWTETVSASVAPGPENVIVSTVRDIGDRRRTEMTLRHQAMTDPLTGVANRTVFMDRLQQALRRVQRSDHLVAVLFLDLDRFKLINDTLGHLMGDAVLLQMAERLRAFLRPQDTLARLGGDEFAVVVEDIARAEEAIALGDRIIEAGRAPFRVGDEEFVCTTSVGISVTTDAHHSPEGLLQEADLALYRAKDRGRNRREVFDTELRTRAVGRLAIERMLRRAIEEDRLRVAYQPIIDLRSGCTVAAEALVRVWDADAQNLLVAESFIEVAEETGLLGPIDEWMLVQAIAQATSWRSELSASSFSDVAINVTGRHLADAQFVPSVISALADHGVPTDMLQIEVTERVLMEASNSAITALSTLRDAGVKVGLDDFGTGYSSLSYLRLFPLDFVKIDRSFVRDLNKDGPERAIVGSVVDLCHALGMAVVAEGVETTPVLECLEELGCDRAQGYLFAAAGPAEALADRVLNLPCHPPSSR